MLRKPLRKVIRFTAWGAAPSTARHQQGSTKMAMAGDNCQCANVVAIYSGHLCRMKPKRRKVSDEQELGN